MATKLTASEITERINKAREAVAKKEKSIARLEKEIPTLTGYMKECRTDDLRRRKEELEEKKQNLKNWQGKLEQLNAENKKLNELPEQLKAMQKQIAEEIEEDTRQFIEKMKKDSKEMEYKEFRKRYKYSVELKYYYMKDDEIKKEAAHEAKEYVLDLIHRAEKKVGQITKWNVHIDIRALNGWVEGTKGKAVIETIFAGGYNIQCLHTRVLVK